jgi:type II secretion system (T2SS) protein M
MSRFQSLSAWFRRLSRRERLIVSAGALVSALALLSVWVVLPLARRWQDREATINLKQTQLAQLQTLVANNGAIRKNLAERQAARVALRQRLLTGSTPALAASNLQALLQGYADASQVSLDRVDVVAAPGTEGGQGLPAVPVRLSGQGDIYGLTSLLDRLQNGEKLLVIDELSVNAGGVAGYRPDLLVFSVRLHGAYTPD